MRRLTLVSVVLALLLLLAAPALAASGKVTIDDPDGLLGSKKGEVQAAAQRLADTGADVAVIVVNNDRGNKDDPNGGIPYLNDQIKKLGIGTDYKNLAGNGIVFFRAANGHSAVYYAPGYKAKLDPAVKDIFATKMRPKFTSSDIAGGMIDGLDAVRLTVDPPTSPLIYVLGAGAALGGGALVLGPQLRKRQATAASLATAKQRMDTVHGTAGAAIADLGQLLRNAREKAKYDRLSYSPADAQRIGEAQARGEQLFADAQAAYDQGEQDAIGIKPDTAAYEKVTASYVQAETLTGQASELIKQAERLRATLDRNVEPQGPTTGPTQRL